MSSEEKLYTVNSDYIKELERKFRHIEFKRLERTDGKYITNSINISFRNDIRIFSETQIKRTLRGIYAPFVSSNIKRKLSYFSQEEDSTKIYQLDDSLPLHSDEEYSVQNVGHATQLIQIPGFNILTDPVFNGLNRLLYPEKTISHPSICNLPQIDVVLLSHNHPDHLDTSSLRTLLKHYKTKSWSSPKVLVPMGDKQVLQNLGFRDVEEVEWFTKITIGEDGKNEAGFVSIPSDHRSGRHGVDHHQSLVTGWVINPEHSDVVFKFSGDTRSLSDENQKAVDAVLWNEIEKKMADKEDDLPDIVCFEPSGPNYTRCDMDVTHQSGSYSALLKFIEAKNLAGFGNKSFELFLKKIRTVMMHHNKFELGPDRFNEALFVIKKLLLYLELDQEDLDKELAKQSEKLSQKQDYKKLKKNTSFMIRPDMALLPNRTSILVHSKDFIIQEISEVTKKLETLSREEIRNCFIKYLTSSTVFPKIGERLNSEQLMKKKFDVEELQKYSKKT